MNPLGKPNFFPSPELADPQGVVLVGGRLNTPWLLDAYRHAIFPWPVDEGLNLWCSPDPRAVLELDGLIVSRRLARTMRSGKFMVTCDRDFAGVIHGCATAQDRRQGTWITSAIRRAYQQLHKEGHAHSVEVWHDGQLAGGIYGVALGGAFSAESMFYAVRDASKVALAHLVRHLWRRGYALLDVQQATAHSRRLGATTIPRAMFLVRLADALKLNVEFGAAMEPWPDEPT